MPRGPYKPSSRPPLTHFLCLPLLTPTSTPQLASSLSYFKSTLAGFSSRSDSVGSHQSGKQNPPSLLPQASIRPLGTLHLTLGVMSLQNEEKVNSALKVLQDLDVAGLLREVTESAARPVQQDAPIAVAPLCVNLAGLHAFPSASKATVLHMSPVDPTHRLMPFCVSLREHFVDAGVLLPDPDRPMMLHATVVNTVYVNRNRRNEGQKRMGKITFDATELMNVFNRLGGLPAKTLNEGDRAISAGDDSAKDMDPYIWASDLLIDKVRICEMGAKSLTGQEESDRGEFLVQVEDAKERMLLEQEYRLIGEKDI